MEPITNNEFPNSVLETEAWKGLYQNGNLSMAMIDKLVDKLDREESCGNKNVLWTIDGINKYAYKTHWNEFSQSCPNNIITATTLQKFASKWDWKALSNRDALYNNWHMLDKFADHANWGEVISNWNIEKAG